MFLRPSNKTEVLKIISKLDNKKSRGPDLIPVTLVKSCSDNLSEPLTMIINCFFLHRHLSRNVEASQGYYHSQKRRNTWLEIIASSAYLVFLVKCLRKLHIRLYSFITKYKILYDLQFGFRNNHSTTLYTIDIGMLLIKVKRF